jgi:hypothetical protein
MEPLQQTDSESKMQGCAQERLGDLGAAGMCPPCIDVKDPDELSSDGDESDTGPAKLWNPHSGLKPSEEDGEASDGDVDMEDDLPYGTAFEVNGEMVEMIVDLEDDCNLD